MHTHGRYDEILSCNILGCSPTNHVKAPKHGGYGECEDERSMTDVLLELGLLGRPLQAEANMA